MIVRYRKSFTKDLKKLKNVVAAKRITRKINEIVTAAPDVDSIEALRNRVAGFKSMTNNPGQYRIRVGDYRLGVVEIEVTEVDDTAIEFTRCLIRGKFYNYWPE